MTPCASSRRTVPSEVRPCWAMALTPNSWVAPSIAFSRRHVANYSINYQCSWHPRIWARRTGSMGRSKTEPVRLVSTARFPPSDDALIGALLVFCNGDPLEFRSGQGAGTTQRMSDAREAKLRSHFSELLVMASNNRADLAQDFMPIGIELLSSLRVQPKIVGGPSSDPKQFGRFSIRMEYARYFPNLSVALNYSILLLLDDSLPYGEALSRCHLSTCGRFYLAARNLRGGPANRTYCRPRHRDIAHDRRENRRHISGKQQ